MLDVASDAGPFSRDSTSGMRPASSNWLKTNLPCRSACPVGTHAGGYVSLISQGHYKEAFLLARSPNPFASVCGRICAHPCEAACRRQHIDEAISIRAMKRFVNERYGVESGATFDEILEVIDRPRPVLEKGGRVAIVGAGPSGLACAHDLALMGHKPVVYEAAKVAGGMMRMGIPEYRLPRDLIQKEIDFIEYLGVEIRLGVEIGRDVTFRELRDGHDAVFVAPGCRKGRSLKLPGMDLEGVLTAVDFLVNANLGLPLHIGEDLLVVGGGNVAFDVARTARRFGGTSEPDESHHNLMFDAVFTAARTLNKKVTMVSLEARDELPADAEEIAEAEREGVTLYHRRGPSAVLGGNGRVRALQTVDCTRVFDADGRFAPQFAEGSEKEIECDTVVFAIGQVADLAFLGDDHGLEVTPRNTVAVDRETLSTSVPGIYAGGDVAFGPRIVIEAVSDGRRAAKAIDTFLTGRTDEPAEIFLRKFDTFGYAHPFAVGDYDRLDRTPMPTIDVRRRSAMVEVETGFTKAQARREGKRCLHCWINTIFDSRKMSGSECIQCGGCVDVCPEDCIDLVGILRIRRGSGSALRLSDGSSVSLVAGSGASLIKDETTCIRCGLCARRCPVGCISMQGFYERREMGILELCETAL